MASMYGCGGPIMPEHDLGLEGWTIKTSPAIYPRFINSPSANFRAIVLMRDDRGETSIYQLEAVDPVECLNHEGHIVAVSPGNIFSCEGYNLDQYFGLEITLEVTETSHTIKAEVPTEPAPAPTQRSE